MRDQFSKTVTAFAATKKIASGELVDVAAKVKKYLQDEGKSNVLIFCDRTSQQVEIDFRGSVESVVKRLEVEVPKDKKVGPGRPKLGVTAKEVTLLPQHWDWLSAQPGGASVTIRKLVDEAKKKNFAKDQIRNAQDAAYRFMTAMAGDLPNFEEALRSLYAKDKEAFGKWLKGWPKDIRDHIAKLSASAFSLLAAL